MKKCLKLHFYCSREQEVFWDIHFEVSNGQVPFSKEDNTVFTGVYSIQVADEFSVLVE